MQPNDDRLPQPQPSPNPMPCGCPTDAPFLAIHAGGVHIVIEKVPRWIAAVGTTVAASVVATIWSLLRH